MFKLFLSGKDFSERKIIKFSENICISFYNNKFSKATKYTPNRSYTMFRILTLYLAKDYVNEKCYNSILRQKDVEQDILVVSAKKIDVPNNFLVEVPQDYPLPIRVGMSINRALVAYWNPKKYDYFFKVDNDVLIAPDYLLNLISKKRPIIGPGCAMLIESHFFEKYFGGRWAISYCDDMYMKAYAFAMGFIKDIWERDIKLIDYEYNPSSLRGYIYGEEHYRFGAPFWFMCLRMIASAKNFLLRRPDRIPVAASVYALAGYLSELGKAKYEWHTKFSERLTKLYIKKIFSILIEPQNG
jgi:hypothetical protein